VTAQQDCLYYLRGTQTLLQAQHKLFPYRIRMQETFS
jgi:hypothetical protein